MLSLYSIIDASINKNHHGDKRLCVRIARVTLPLSSLPGAEGDVAKVVSVDGNEPRKPIIGIFLSSTKHLELIVQEINRNNEPKAWRSECAAERDSVLRSIIRILKEEHNAVPDTVRLKVFETTSMTDLTWSPVDCSECGANYVREGEYEG